jgi:uncharacterized protein YsxB (DUF464 family)
MEGHADFNPGNDVVCSAISILCYTMAQNYMDCFRRHELKEKPKIDLTPGKAVISAKPKEEYRRAFEVMTDAVLTGFVLLKNKYPDNIKLVNGNGEEDEG